MKYITIKQRLGRVFCVSAACLFILMGLPVRSFAASDFSRTLAVGEYTVRSNGVPTASSIESGNKVSISAPVIVRGITPEQAGALTISAKSDSFRMAEESARVETEKQEGNTLRLKVFFDEVTYRGKGNSIRFTLTYQNGDSDEGSVDILECVEEKRGRKDRDDDDDKSDKKETLYGAPPLLINSDPLPELLRPGQEFTVKIGIRNLSPRLSAFNLVVGFEPTDGILLAETVSSRYIQSLHTMQEKYFTVRLRANREVSNPAQSLGITVKYEYIENSQRGSASSSEKINLPFDPQAVGFGDVATPNVIISKFDYGMQIAVGDTFDLALNVKNTNPSVGIENLVMTLEPGEGFTFVDSSNTFYFPKMAAGGTLDQKVKVRALAPFSNSKPDYKIECSFKYEYLVGAKRTQVTSAERLSFPVYYPDRFEISPPTLSDEAIVGNELTITLPYVNKGKAEISNVEVEITGEVEALESHQNLGNFEAGKSGSIDFVVKPKAAGETVCSIKITYEDSNMKVKTVEHPVTLNVTEAAPAMEEMGDFPPEPQGVSVNQIAIPAAGLLVLVGGVLFLKRRKKAKRPALGEFAVAWTPEQQTEGQSDEQK